MYCLDFANGVLINKTICRLTLVFTPRTLDILSTTKNSSFFPENLRYTLMGSWFVILTNVCCKKTDSKSKICLY